MFDPIPLYPVAWSSWCIKFTITLIQVSFAFSTRNIYPSCCSFLAGRIRPGSSGVSVNYGEKLLVHLALQGPEGWNWKGHVLKTFLTTWLVLTDAWGTIQNRGSLPRVHVRCTSPGSCLLPMDPELTGLEGFAMGNLKSSPKPEDHWTERKPLSAPCSVGKSHEEGRFPFPRYTSLPRAAPPMPLLMSQTPV